MTVSRPVRADHARPRDARKVRRRTPLGRTLRRALASYACFYAAVALGWYVDDQGRDVEICGCGHRLGDPAPRQPTAVDFAGREYEVYE